VPTGHAAANLDLSTTGSTVAKREKIAWDEVCSKAAKVVSFIDLAGHERSVEGLGDRLGIFTELSNNYIDTSKPPCLD
jgi:hypothetical protein